MFEVLCRDPNFVEAAGYSSCKDGQIINEVAIYMDQRTADDGIYRFNSRLVRNSRRLVIDVLLEAQPDHILVHNLMKPGVKGDANFRIFHDSIGDGMEAIITVNGINYDCKLVPPKSQTQSQYKPWETRPFIW